MLPNSTQSFDVFVNCSNCRVSFVTSENPMIFRCFADSSAARGVAMRRGGGGSERSKHLETKTLWVQNQVDRGIVKINKISGSTIQPTS